MELKENFNYFLENLDEFCKEYKNKYIVIKNKQVIGIYPTFEEARKETNKTEQEGTYLIQLCTKNSNTQTFYSYQLIGA